MTIEDIQHRIYEIHDMLDIGMALIMSDIDDNDKPIVYTKDQQIKMYIDLVNEMHDMLMALADGISSGILPPSIWKDINEP